MSLAKIARNQQRDEVLSLFGPLAHRVLSDHWDVYAQQSSYHSLINNEKDKGSLTTYSLLKPSIFNQFGETIIASDCFGDTVLNRLWAAQGVPMEPVHQRLRQD